MMLFGTNGLASTSDQVEKSEVDVSKNLKRKKRFTAEEARRLSLDISDSASSCDYTQKNNVKNRTAWITW